MRIGWWDCGNLDNMYCGNDGGSNLRIPLLRDLNDAGHTVLVDMQDPGNYTYRETGLRKIEKKIKQRNFREEAYRFRESLDCVIESRMDRNTVRRLDAVIVEARREDMRETEQSKRVMKYAITGDTPLFIMDRNNWARQYPDWFADNSYLLRPYREHNKHWTEARQFFWPYFHRRDVPETDLEPEYDLVYIGNRYGREEQMDEFLDGLEDLDILVCGNWPDRDQEVTEKYDFDFVGSTPHFATIPTLRLGKASFHVGKPDYNEIGMLTLRPFEASTAGRPCFVSSKIKYAFDLVENHEWVTNESDWVKMMLERNQTYFDHEARSNFTRSVTDARVQLEQVIENVS